MRDRKPLPAEQHGDRFIVECDGIDVSQGRVRERMPSANRKRKRSA